jgi:hypothetical protein
LWDAVLEEAKPGDFVLIQTGQDDAGPLSGDNRERARSRALATNQRTSRLRSARIRTSVHTSAVGGTSRKYVADVKAAGVTRSLLARPALPEADRQD